MISVAISIGARIDPGSVHRDDRVYSKVGLMDARYIEKVFSNSWYLTSITLGMNFFSCMTMRGYTARIVQDYFIEVGFRVMEWPTCNPDLNSIEHLQFKRGI